MHRVVSVWLPTWSTDKLRLCPDAPSPDMPLITAAHDGHRRVIAAADRAALALGLRPALPLAQTQTAVPDLAIADADPEGDTAALERLAAWCLRYAPLAEPDAPDGVLLDITGCAHLWGGEAAIVDDLLGCLSERGCAARAAVAGTIGAAHTLARYAAGERPVLVEPGGDEDAVSPLPIAALRLPAGTVDSPHRVGLERVGQLLAAPGRRSARCCCDDWSRQPGARPRCLSRGWSASHRNMSARDPQVGRDFHSGPNGDVGLYQPFPSIRESGPPSTPFT